MRHTTVRYPALTAFLGVALCSAANAEETKLETTLKTVDQVVSAGPFAASWESLGTYQVPAWYEDAKFGIFIHWGPFSVPAFGSEWYPRNMYRKDSAEFKHHVATYGPQSKFGYRDFIPQFKAERFDADGWAEVFRQAGAKFVVPVAEHHDGFAMYDCGFSDWNAVKMGPRRDIVGEIAKAVRRKGLVFGLSSHRAEHWWFFNGGRDFESDVQDSANDRLYGPATPGETEPDKGFLDNWLARTSELVDKYHPQLVWFDWWIGRPSFKPYLQKFGAFYYDRGAQWNKGVAINYKYDAYPDNAAVLDIERGQLAGIRPKFWQTDTSISKNSWGYVTNQDYKTSGEIIGDLVDIVSKNGALLLNIGPRPDGTIPEEEESILLAIGRWLKVNGEAIYGTRPWKVFGEGPTQVAEGAFSDTKRQRYTGKDVRFTRKGDTLYAIVLAWPGETVTIKSLSTTSRYVSGEISDVRLLGHRGKLKFTRDAEGLTVLMPVDMPSSDAVTLKIAGAG